MTVTIEVMGETVVAGNLDRHARRAINPTPAYLVLADRFLDVEERQFDTQGASSGHPWMPLAAATLDEKARHGMDPRILHRTLALRASLTEASAPGHVRRITPAVLELGTSVTSDSGYPYPASHQEGRGVPRRKPVDLTDYERGRWARIVHRYIVHGELLRAGAREVLRASVF